MELNLPDKVQIRRWLQGTPAYKSEDVCFRHAVQDAANKEWNYELALTDDWTTRCDECEREKRSL